MYIMELASDGFNLVLLLGVFGFAETQVTSKRWVGKLDESVFNTSLYPFPGYNKDALFTRPKFLPLLHYTCMHTRPIKDHTRPLLMMVSMKVLRIMKLDAAKQAFQFLGKFWFKYQHDWLKWDDNSLIDAFPIPTESLWTPDFDILNSIGRTSTFDTRSYVRAYQGYGFLSFTVIYTLPCNVEMRNFPFDVQHCVMVLGSSHETSGRYKIVPILDKDTNENYFINAKKATVTSEWNLLDYYSKNFNVTHSGVTFDEIHCTVVLKRYSPFYVQFLLIPSLVVVIVTLTLFWLPIVRPDRFIVGLSAFTILIVLLLMVVKISPPSADLKIAHYYSLQIVLVSVSTFLSAIILVVSQSTSKVPSIVRKVYVDVVGRMLGITQQYESVYPLNDNNDPLLSIVRDWQIIATTTDRVHFIIYFFVAFFGISIVFPYPQEYILEERPPYPMDFIDITGFDLFPY